MDLVALDERADKALDRGLVRLATATTGVDSDESHLERLGVWLKELLALQISTTKAAWLGIALAELDSGSNEEADPGDDLVG